MIPRNVSTSEDVTKDILEIAEDIHDGWYPEGRIDWDDFLWRMESHGEIDMGNNMLSPAITKIKVHIRNYRRGK